MVACGSRCLFKAEIRELVPAVFENEFHFQLGFGQGCSAVTSSRGFLLFGRPGDRSLYVSGVLQGGDPVLYIIYCHLIHSIRGPPNVRHVITCVQHAGHLMFIIPLPITLDLACRL